MNISEPAEYAMLGLLSMRQMHGYELFQHFENGVPGQIVHLEMSQMYAFLKKLERLAYIEAEVEPQGARPPRKIFHITSQGQDIFQSWLKQPVQKPRDIRMLFLIKLYFIQRFHPAETPRLISQQILACQNFLDNLRAKQKSANQQKREMSDAAFFDHIILTSRIHQTYSLLEWLRELRDEVGAETPV